MNKIILLSIVSTIVFSPNCFAVKENQKEEYLEFEENERLGFIKKAKKQDTMNGLNHHLINQKIMEEGRLH